MKKAISLFSGAGGDTLGLEKAGYKVVAFSESNKAAIQTHLANFPESVHLSNHTSSDSHLTQPQSDIKDIPNEVFEQYKGKIDVVFAGFPCQGFSNAGKKKENDPRNELVYEFVRVVKCVQPEWFIGENVKGLLSRKGVDPITKKKRPVIHIIQSLFEEINYKMTWNVVTATDFDVPQERKRLIIVGHKGTMYPHFPWSVPNLYTPTIRNVLEDTLEGAMIFPKNQIPSHLLDSTIWIKTSKESCMGSPHPNLVRLVNGIRNKSSKELLEEGTDSVKTIQVEGGLISFCKRISSQHGQICDPDGPSKTIICTYGICPRLFLGLYNTSNDTYYIRTFTKRELAQIQGFPEEYVFCGNEKAIITQIGNAVPPQIVKYIAENLDKVEYKTQPQTICYIDEDDEDE